jgi:hypothetical protein
MIKCWASSLGNCSDVQSGEHYVTRGLFKGKTVIANGFDWLNGGTKEIGLSSLTANILCNHHNSQLSVLDSEAIRVFETFDEIHRLEGIRRSLKPKKIWQVKRHRVNAKLFERWVAKLLVGIFCVIGKDDHWYLTNTSKDNPPETIVKGIFGEASFEMPMGIYLAQPAGVQPSFTDGLIISVQTFPHPDGGFVAGLIEFQGFRFFFWMAGKPVLSFSTPEGTLFGPEGQLPMYHHAAIRFTIGKALSQVLEFDWT